MAVWETPYVETWHAMSLLSAINAIFALFIIKKEKNPEKFSGFFNAVFL